MISSHCKVLENSKALLETLHLFHTVTQCQCSYAAVITVLNLQGVESAPRLLYMAACTRLARHACVHRIHGSFTLCWQRSLCLNPPHVLLSQRNIIRRLLLLPLRRKPLDSGLITGHGNLDCPAVLLRATVECDSYPPSTAVYYTLTAFTWRVILTIF